VLHNSNAIALRRREERGLPPTQQVRSRFRSLSCLHNQIASNNIHFKLRFFSFIPSAQGAELMGCVSADVEFALQQALNVVAPEASTLDFGLEQFSFGWKRNRAGVIDCCDELP
jgi:hypothetical protein